jgi:hypothetical protein
MSVDIELLDAYRSYYHYTDVYSSLAYASWKSADNTMRIRVSVHVPINVPIHPHGI